jgi:hypothetical protein
MAVMDKSIKLPGRVKHATEKDRSRDGALQFLISSARWMSGSLEASWDQRSVALREYLSSETI